MKWDFKEKPQPVICLQRWHPISKLFVDLFNFLLLLLGCLFFWSVCVCLGGWGGSGGGEREKLSVDGWNVLSDSLSFLFKVIIFLSLPVPLYYTKQKGSSDCTHMYYTLASCSLAITSTCILLSDPPLQKSTR